LSSAKELAERARKLGEHESAVGAHDEELQHLQHELSAAEELLAEVDSQRDALKQQVHDQSAELWKLRNEIQASHHKSNIQRARTMMLTRSNVRKTEVVANRLEDQLKAWVRKVPLNVNFSEHGHASIVRDAFGKLDREFIERYFSHVTNPEYERGRKRAIHVHSGKDPDGEEYGELRIALDDDAGRTLGLRFELKKGAPDAKSVGLVLAMYLRAMNRELRDFEIA
jgi:small-conductance mechanosensitive channel